MWESPPGEKPNLKIKTCVCTYRQQSRLWNQQDLAFAQADSCSSLKTDAFTYSPA